VNKNKNTFKEDIETAERNILTVSWLGIVVSIGIIFSSLVSLL